MKRGILQLQLDYISLTIEGNSVTSFEFFLPPGLDHAIHPYFARLDDEFGLTSRADQALELHKLVELNCRPGFVHFLLFVERWPGFQHLLFSFSRLSQR